MSTNLACGPLSCCRAGDGKCGRTKTVRGQTLSRFGKERRWTLVHCADASRTRLLTLKRLPGYRKMVMRYRYG